MAIRFEIIHKLDENDLKLVDELEKEIDENLLSQKGEETIYHYVHGKCRINKFVAEEIIKRYKKVGWRDVRFISNSNIDIRVYFFIFN